jgi:hypothetical protein
MCVETSGYERPGFTFHWPAALVLLLAAVFRIVALQDVPPGLAQDEVLNADIVTLIRAGQHALFFREGYGHEPLYHYWSVPFQSLLGDNVLSIRLPAVFLGLLLISAALRWVRRDFGSIAAIATGLGLAVSWWPIIFSRIGLRPILEPLLLVPMAYFWRRRPWISGLCIGLSFYAYTAARVLFIVPILFAVYTLVSARISQPSVKGIGLAIARLRPAAIVLFFAIVLYLPLGLLLRTDPSLQQRVQQLEEPLNALRQGDVRPVFETAVATLGVFSFAGDPRWTYTIPGAALFDPITAILFYGGVLLALTRLRQAKYALIIIWLGVTLLPSALAPQAPSTVRLVGAIPVVYLLPGITIDWLHWRLDRIQTTVTVKRRLALLGALLALSVLSLNAFRTISDGLLRWPAELETRLKYQSVLLDISRQWRRNPVEAPVVATSFFEPITYDSLRRDLGSDPEARWVQTGSDLAGAIVFPRLSESGSGGRLYVPEYAAPASDLMARAGIRPQPQYRSEAIPSFAIYHLPATPPVPGVTAGISFESLVTLVGYEIEPVQPGTPLRLFSYWRVEASLPSDLAIFVHLLDRDGHIVAQHDGFDAAAATLQVGDRFIQRHLLPLADNPSPQPHTLQLGLYTRGDLRRLKHAGVPDDRIILVSEWILTESE